MATNTKSNPSEKKDFVVRARVENSLKSRLNKYRKSLSVKPSESFVVQIALDEFLARREQSPAAQS